MPHALEGIESLPHDSPLLVFHKPTFSQAASGESVNIGFGGTDCLSDVLRQPGTRCTELFRGHPEPGDIQPRPTELLVEPDDTCVSLLAHGFKNIRYHLAHRWVGR